MPWCSKKLSVVAYSSCEVEYIWGVVAPYQANCIQPLLNDLMIKLENLIKLLIDNKSTISLTKNPIAPEKSRHIEIMFHLFKDQVINEKLEVMYCPTEEQMVNMLIRAIKRLQFIELRKKLKVIAFDSFN